MMRAFKPFVALRDQTQSAKRIAFHVLFVGSLFASLLAAHESRGAEKDLAAEERSRNFEWFSKLGYPDVKDARFVRLPTGTWVEEEGDPPITSYRHGFLLGEKDDEFTIFFLDVCTQTLSRSDDESDENEGGNYEIAELQTFAADNVNEPDVSEQRPRGGWPRRFGEQLSERAEIFVLAWACSRKGEGKLAAELYERVVQMPSRRTDARPPLTLQQDLAADLAHAEMWRTVVQFSDPKISREQLLAAFERIVKNFPESEHLARAKTSSELLKRMVQEDRDHAQLRKAGKPFAELSENEQVAELIFQLRDQNGHQWGQPGWCDIFNTSLLGREEDSPAHQLLKLGYCAVPHLIEALDDERFTRSVGFHRNFYFSHHVLRINECAETILTRIAGRQFTAQRSRGPASIKHDVATWYERLQHKGEKAVLLEETAAGGQRAVQLAPRLVKKYPDDALPALVEGIDKTDEPWDRTQLVQWIGGLKGDKPVSFLLKELSSGPNRSSRLAAARALHERGRTEAVPAMIAEWNRPDDEQVGAFGWRGDELILFLTSCGSVEAIEALSHNFHERSVDVKMEIVSALGPSSPESLVSHGKGGMLHAGESSSDQPSPKLRAAIRKLLLAALDDTEQRMGLSGSWNGKDFSDSRICDVAGHVLYGLDETRYAFDLAASQRKRDHALLALKNVLRQELGLDLLPIPPARIVQPISEEALRPQLEKLELASGAESAEKVEMEILQLGQGAFAAVTKRRDQLSADDSRLPRIQQLARRLSLVIVDVKFAEKSLAPEQRLADRLAALKNKPFEIKTIQELVAMLTDKLPADVRGVRLAVAREADGEGVTLRIDLLNRKRAEEIDHGASAEPGTAVPADRPYSWSYHQSARLGKKTLLNSSGVGSDPPGLPGDAEFAKHLKKLVSSSPEKPFELRLEIIGIWKE